jgi:hypothetical protein
MVLVIRESADVRASCAGNVDFEFIKTHLSLAFLDSLLNGAAFFNSVIQFSRWIYDDGGYVSFGCPPQPVDATHALNFFRWGFELQCFPWSLVELAPHHVEMSLRVYRQQVRPFGEVQPEQAIDVLIGSSLPRGLRIAEVNFDVRRKAEPPMSRQ